MKRTPLKRKTPLRKRSSRKAKLDREYTKLRKKYLDENPICEWWLAENGFMKHANGYINIEGMYGFTPIYDSHRMDVIFGAPRSAEIHHMRKPRITYQNDTSTWMAVSRLGHEWIENNKKLAREKGYLY